MAQFSEDQWYETITPSCCNVPFAMSIEHYRNRQRDRQAFWCPHCGSRRVFLGKTKEQKLKERLEQEQQRNQELEQQKKRVSAQYLRVRKRIKNGVCPCCNRSFENIANHMRTKHPDYAEEKQLKTLRLAFGLTQSDLASECGVKATYISLFENGKNCPEWAAKDIQWWLDQQSA